MKRRPSFPDSLASKGVVVYWRAIRRWLFFTVVDVQSCLLFAIHYIVYAKPAYPISTVDVPPNLIKNSIEPTKFVRRGQYRFSGLIKRKDWEHIIPLQVKHKKLVDQFREFFVGANPQISRQEQSDLASYQLLFETLSTMGFAVPTWRNRKIDPFYLSIGANGEFLFMTGKHRLALAKVAGVKAIPARISARHWQWQAYRDELYKKGKNGDLSLAELDAIEHPDLQDIVLAIKRLRALKKTTTGSRNISSTD